MILFGVAVNVLIAFGVVLTFSEIRQENYHSYATNARKAAIEREFKDKCSKIAIVDELHRCFETVISADWDGQRAQEDLKAQKDVANYAFLMLVVTTAIGVPSLIMTSVGIYIVWRSLLAARDAITATRELSAAENGGWIKISEVSVTESPIVAGNVCRVGISGTIKNIGRSPSHSIIVRPVGIPENDLEDFPSQTLEALRRDYMRYASRIKRALFPDETHKFSGGVEFLLIKKKRTSTTVIDGVPAGVSDGTVGSIYLCVFYKIVGDDAHHETIRAYFVNGLNLSDFTIPSEGRTLSLLPNDLLAGSTT